MTGGTWYPPSVGTGGFMITNPLFAAMTNDLDQTLQERGQRYGTFTGNAEITIALKDVISTALAQRGRVLADDQTEALHMIAHKIGRIINGDPDYADSWVDIAGYAQLVANRLTGEGAQ